MGQVCWISVSPGGVPKTGLHEARVSEDGLAGDAHRSSKHGGPMRAVCLYSLERILALQAEGHPIFPGSTGENVTVSGVDWDSVGPGTRLRLGANVELEVTQYTKPCSNVVSSFRDGDIGRMDQTGHPGWARVYAKVVRAGSLRVGDAATAEAAPPA